MTTETSRYISGVLDVHQERSLQYYARTARLRDAWKSAGLSVQDFERVLYTTSENPLPLANAPALVKGIMMEEFGVPVQVEEWHNRYEIGIIWEIADNGGLVEITLTDFVAGKVHGVGLHDTETQEGALLERVMDAFINKANLTRERASKTEIMVNYAFPDKRGGVYTLDRTFTPEPLDSIAGNYTQDVVAQMHETVRMLHEATNGLVVLNGPPGTGKTHLLRAMLTEVAHHREGVVCNPPLDFLTEMGLLARATTMYDASLIVLEDLGDILTEQSPTEHTQVNANLLNVTDGLLSLLSNSVIVLTFNTDIEKINEAVLRPGRCIAHIKVDLLEAAQVRSMMVEAGLGHVELTRSKYSLAEVYEMKRIGSELHNTERKPKMGLLPTKNSARPPAGFQPGGWD